MTFTTAGSFDLFIRQLFFYPCHQQTYDLLLLERRQSCFFLHFIPFIETPSAAARAGMLRDEYGMSSPGSLFAVIRYICRSQTVPDKILRMTPYGIQTFLIYILPVLFRQMKTSAEFRLPQALKSFSYSCHVITSSAGFILPARKG